MSVFNQFKDYVEMDLYPFNNQHCNLFQKSSTSCSRNKSASVLKLLGPKGKVGIPYKYFKCSDPNDVSIYKSSKFKKPTLKKYTSKNKTFCGLDEFTNESFIGLMIHDLVKNNEYVSKSYVKQFGAYICPNTSSVYNHMELCDLGDMTRKIDTAVLSAPQKKFCENKQLIVAHCLFQVSSIISFLQEKSSYSHGDLKAGNIFIKNEKTVTECGKYRVRSPITFKIADYGKNCISVDKYRLYNHTVVSKFLSNHNFSNQKNSLVLNKYKHIPDYLRSQLIYSHMRHLGSSIMGDVDIYIFVLSLLFNPIYSQAVIELPKKFHQILWYPDQINFIHRHLLKIKSKVKPNKLRSVTTPMIFLTTPLENGSFIRLKKGNAKRLSKFMCSYVRNL